LAFGEGKAQVFAIGSLGVLNSNVTQSYPIGGYANILERREQLCVGRWCGREGVSEATDLRKFRIIAVCGDGPVLLIGLP
jgi:hypothetical protein